METVTPAGLPPLDAPAEDVTGPDLEPVLSPAVMWMPKRRAPIRKRVDRYARDAQVTVANMPVTTLLVAGLAGVGLFAMVRQLHDLIRGD